MTLHEQTKRRLLAQLAAPAANNDATQLNNALRMLGKWRSASIQDLLLKQNGTLVQQGPLRGLDFVEASAEGCHVAKLLGTYEQPLHPYIEQAVGAAYATIVNIGCAEGYYAVGLARRLPDSRILAFDSNPRARASCQQLAQKNAVGSRVQIEALFQHADFAALPRHGTLVLCDIEGAERELLDPAKAPALQHLDLIVESHECLVPGVTRTLIERFAATHALTLVQDSGQRHLQAPPPWFLGLSHLDQLLAVWEWRSGPTPWLVMKSRQARTSP